MCLLLKNTRHGSPSQPLHPCLLSDSWIHSLALRLRWATKRIPPPGGLALLRIPSLAIFLFTRSSRSAYCCYWLALHDRDKMDLLDLWRHSWTIHPQAGRYQDVQQIRKDGIGWQRWSRTIITSSIHPIGLHHVTNPFYCSTAMEDF